MASWTDTLSQIRVVLFEEAGSWSAQCLDYDIAAQAKALLDLPDEIVRVLTVHVVASARSGREPFAEINPAPQRFWDLFDSGMRLESRPMQLRADEYADLPAIHPQLRIARSLAL